jgi:hypothetical protein
MIKERRSPMSNHYEMAEVVEIGRAQDVILGSWKWIWNFCDCPSAWFRETETADDE